MLIIAASSLLSACAPGEDKKDQDAGNLKIYFINVGKGDAALIGTPDHKWIMVDVGHADEFAHVGRILKQNSVTELEAVFISHQHNDHFGALGDVLSHVSCKVIYTTPFFERFKHAGRFSDMAEQAGVPVEFLHPGDTLDISGLRIDILGPNGAFAEEDDNSLVKMLTWDGQKVLFTGDQRYAAENELLKAGFSVQSDVLKAGNHGRNASSEDFLRAVGAKHCVITNDFKGKEYDESVSHFASYGMQVYVLGHTGTMLCEIGGGTVNFYAVKSTLDQAVPDIVFEDLSASGAFAAIKNNSLKEVSLKGWSFMSAKDKTHFFFPDSSSIKPGQTLKVSDDMFGKIKKKDSLVLYDQYGRAVDSIATK